ncbi:RNA-binding protein [Fodinicurvata sp. EGI_FJ10296]|uniref:RNA-binding protein n=1 Tax=Fodinicurvata sp. EGI_FJ10296 TaxID=3231908 RepID=UPI00345608D0
MNPPDSGGSDSQDDDEDDRHNPVRRCFVSGDRLDKERLIRFVTGPDGTVVPDLDNNLPGRGYYLRAERTIIEQAIAKRLFGRGARRSVTVPNGLLETIEWSLRRRCLDLIGLANRSGRAVAGYEKVRKAVADGQADILLTASDAGTDGLRRARSLASAAGPKTAEITAFTGSSLGSIFGRDVVVHVAVAKGGLATRLRRDARRYTGVALAADGGERPG